MEKLAVLQDDENYLVEQVRYGGELAIRKSLKATADERRRATFLNEQQGTKRFGELATAHPEWGLVIPRIMTQHDTWVLREYVDGTELVALDMSLEEARVHLGQLAHVLAAVDTVSPEKAEPWDGDSAPFANIRRRFDVWSEGPLKEDVLDTLAYKAANELIDEYQSLLAPRYAHGDMSPFKHVFAMSQGLLAFIDFEHYSPLKPRYYDVAYAYSRLRMQAHHRGLAGVFLSEFLRAADRVPNQKEQMLAIMTQRAIGMHFDALNDYKKGIDYRKRAQDFLTVCLERNIDRLTDA